jgi:uncharacterized RmlC-like cupin family protein
MSEKIRVVSHEALESGPPTAGMVRSQAFTSDNFWMGEVRTQPEMQSGWHHHGDYTTYGYVISGRIRFQFGAGGDEHVDAGPGDFFRVPPHTVHLEGNPAAEEQILAVIRVGTGPTVVNVEGPDAV